MDSRYIDMYINNLIRYMNGMDIEISSSLLTPEIINILNNSRVSIDTAFIDENLNKYIKDNNITIFTDNLEKLKDKRVGEVKTFSGIVLNDTLGKEEKNVRFLEYFPFRDVQYTLPVDLALLNLYYHNGSNLNHTANFEDTFSDLSSSIPFSEEDRKRFNEEASRLIKTNNMYVLNFSNNHRIFHDKEFVGNFSNQEINDEFNRLKSKHIFITDLGRENNIIGRRAELKFFENESERLISLGREDLAYSLIWASRIADGLGYDFITHDVKTGEEMLVEVKGTASKNNFSCFTLTENENKHFNSDKNYYVYRIYTPLSENEGDEIEVVYKDHYGNVVDQNGNLYDSPDENSKVFTYKKK